MVSISSDQLMPGKRESDPQISRGWLSLHRFGNKYFQNLNEHEEIPGRHRWVDYAQVCLILAAFERGEWS